MKHRSGKAKGKRFEDEIVKDLRFIFGCSDDEIRRNPASCVGSDVVIAENVSERAPFSIECKNREKIAIWETIRQAEDNARKEGRLPLIVFKRNRSRKYAVVNWETLLFLFKHITPEEIKEVKQIIPQMIEV